jgi:2-amino-4-hydroxy-6-hydroxymethyldihydropteridine diphosphokinase
MKKHTYYLIIGSNLGDRLKQLSLAKKRIGQDVGTLVSESSIYETQPWGFEDQPWFLNQVLQVDSSYSPNEVLRRIKTIEVQTGREPGEKWHARHIDIDILLYGEMIIHEQYLKIPHPQLPSRNFVLVPLMELAPELILPGTDKTIEELYFESKDTGEVYIFNPDEQGSPV